MFGSSLELEPYSDYCCSIIPRKSVTGKQVGYSVGTIILRNWIVAIPLHIYISKGFAPAAGPPSNRPDGCKISDPGGTKNGDLRGLEAPF